MRKVLISLAAAAATLAVAAPASAQWAQPRVPYGNANGYGANYGQVRALQARIDQIQRQITFLAQRRMITRYEYDSLIRQSGQVEGNLRHNGRDGRGLNQREFYNTQLQIARLEQNVQRQVRDGRQWRYRW